MIILCVLGSSAISLLPKETPQSQSSAKHKAQPFEVKINTYVFCFCFILVLLKITVRLQINLPDGQKILLRVDPNLPLYEIKERICKQKKYKDSARYSLSLPSRPEKPLLLGLSLAECKTNELNLVYLRSGKFRETTKINYLIVFQIQNIRLIKSNHLIVSIEFVRKVNHLIRHRSNLRKPLQIPAK